MPRPLYPGGTNPRYPLDINLGGPHSWSGHGGEERKIPSTSDKVPRYVIS